MSNNNQLFTEIIPSEEATLSGGNGGYYPKKHYYPSVSIANGEGFADSYGGRINLADVKTFAVTTPYSATAGSKSTAVTVR